MNEPTASARFWTKVHATPECWIWTGAINTTGYGAFHLGAGRVAAHRYAYELAVGPIPPGMQVDHSCRNRACVRPAHLRLLTNKQNGENRSGPTTRSTSGVLGVSWNKERRKWVVTVQHAGRSYYGGAFLTLPEATVAAAEARSRFYSFNDVDREFLKVEAP